MESARFTQFACFDWSGQNVLRPRGLVLAVADRSGPPQLVSKESGWSRRDVIDWLIAVAASGEDVLIGLDLSFALPFVDCGAYFPDWPESPGMARDLWTLVERVSADDPSLSANAFLSHPQIARYFRQHGGRIGDRFGNQGLGRLRLTESCARRAGLGLSASGFNLVGAAQVGKSSLTGMRVLHRLNGAMAIWPFDPIPAHGPVIAEVYPAIAAKSAGIPAGRSKIRTIGALEHALSRFNSSMASMSAYDDHSTDALITAAWLRQVSHDAALWVPPALTPMIAATEGWTFGVV